MKSLCLFKNVRGYMNFISVLLFAIAIYIIVFCITHLRNIKLSVECVHHNVIEKAFPNLPVVKIHGIQEEEKKLDVIKSIFTKLGYNIIFNDTNHWNVLWSHTYPFYSLKNEIMNLKDHQKVNHFPGSGFITQKNNLALLPIDHIPKSFVLPASKDTFLKYAEENKNIFWMIKNSNHRGIRIFNGTENLDLEGTFVQEFIKNPLLINGKKFDIGIYVVLTSIDPLRVYMYSSDILLRFCKGNYFPLNINFIDSYVVSDDYLPIWEVPDLRYYFSYLNFTAKESLNAYLHSKGKSTEFLWHQIHRIIQDVYFSVEEDLKRSTISFGNMRNFFELVRFDFIADEYLNVYLLEVNMSPNLSPAHFPQNKLLYEQVAFNALQIVGLVKKFHDFYRSEAEVSEKDIQVNSEQCRSSVCGNSCQNFKCKLCNHCMGEELRDVFKSAYLEFMNKGKLKRIIPVPTAKVNNHEMEKPTHLSDMNAYMDFWFKGKCLQDTVWCQ